MADSKPSKNNKIIYVDTTKRYTASKHLWIKYNSCNSNIYFIHNNIVSNFHCFKENCKNHPINFSKYCLCNLRLVKEQHTFCRVHPNNFYHIKWNNRPSLSGEKILKCQSIIRKYLLRKNITNVGIISLYLKMYILPTTLFNHILTFIIIPPIKFEIFIPNQ
jgi:hypothetical protein